MSRFSMLFLVAALAACAAQDEPEYDILIVNGSVIDGTGGQARQADVAIDAGVIVAVGELDGAAADRVIDASGRAVTPGFVDMMGGSSLPLLLDPVTAESKLRQGITTMMAGEGGSLAPQNERTFAELELEAEGIAPWTTFEEYFVRLDEAGIALNSFTTWGRSRYDGLLSATRTSSRPKRSSPR